jgi:hypothetical protein
MKKDVALAYENSIEELKKTNNIVEIDFDENL